MAITIYNNSGSPENDFHQYSSLKISQNIHGHHSFDVMLPPSTKYDSLQEVAHLIGNKIKFDIEDGEQLIGVVTTVNFKNNVDNQNFLHLVGYGATVFLENGLVCKSFLEMSIQEIVEEIKNTDGKELMNHLKSTGDFIIQDASPVPEKLLYSVQYKETPFDYISRLADTYGKWFYFNGKKLFFVDKPNKGFPVDLKLGENLFSIDIQLRLSTPQINYSSFDYEQNKAFKGKASISDIKSKDKLTERALNESKSKFELDTTIPSELSFKSNEDLDAWTKTKFKSHTSSIVKFVGTSNEPSLKIGSLVKIVSEKKDLKSRLSTKHGVYRIIKLIHYSASEGVYSNSFVAIPEEMEIPPRNPQVVLPNCEPQSAVVLDSNDKEKKLGRVKVRFRWQSEEESSPWIRVASQYTHKGEGIYFVPEKDEEVLVNFEYNNPDLPYVSNSFYNGENPPKNFNEKNLTKVISTKKGNKIFINEEDGKEIISIRNNDNSCFIDLHMKEKRIVLKSELLEFEGEEININSKGKLKLNADGDMKITSGGNMTLEGKIIDINP